MRKQELTEKSTMIAAMAIGCSDVKLIAEKIYKLAIDYHVSRMEDIITTAVVDPAKKENEPPLTK